MSQSEKTLLSLRQQILRGDLKPGQRLLELQLCQDFNVSRTPVRFALFKLEEEGLLEPLPTAGFKVRSFSEDDIKDAIDFRGMVEGAAARKIAENGVDTQRLYQLKLTIEAIDEILEPELSTEETFTRFVELNREFHEQLLELSDSFVLQRMHKRAISLPFASPNAMVEAQATQPTTRSMLIIAQGHHRSLLGALEKGEGARAEAIGREHARLAFEHLISVMKTRTNMRIIPGASLVPSLNLNSH